MQKWNTLDTYNTYSLHIYNQFYIENTARFPNDERSINKLFKGDKKLILDADIEYIIIKRL